MSVQKEAFKIFPYPCIQTFRFLNMKISKIRGYEEALEIGAKRKGAILLDFGCCFGNDARKAAVDGFPIEQVMATDLKSEFWELGHKLYKSDASTCPIRFVPGDIFDDSFLKVGQIATKDNGGQPAVYPKLASLDLGNSLNPLAGQLSVIHASYFFHLFDEEQQVLIARKLATLLSPEAGSIILGCQAGWTTKGYQTPTVHGVPITSFCHSPESWKELWEKVVFKEGEVACDAYVTKKLGEREIPVHLLVWKVVRV